jgi:hypothetical protein
MTVAQSSAIDRGQRFTHLFARITEAQANSIIEILNGNNTPRLERELTCDTRPTQSRIWKNFFSATATT